MTKIICVALSALLFALTFPAEAQQRAKIYRIDYLGGGLGIDERFVHRILVHERALPHSVSGHPSNPVVQGLPDFR